MEEIQRSLARNGLVRVRDGRIVGGVCAGLGRKFGADPWLVRFVAFLTLVVIPGSQILVYPLAWFLMPDEARAAQLTGPQYPTDTGYQAQVPRYHATPAQPEQSTQQPVQSPVQDGQFPRDNVN